MTVGGAWWVAGLLALAPPQEAPRTPPAASARAREKPTGAAKERPPAQAGPRPPRATDTFPDPFSAGAGTKDVSPLTEEARRALEMERLQSYLAEGRAALREHRYERAVEAFTRALGVAPGDSEALAGRAHARKARTPSHRCPRRAVADLLMLATYDPKGRWIEERGNAYEWMKACKGQFEADRLELARELAGADPKAPGRPDDIRFQLARLLLDRAEAEGRRDARTALRREALEALEAYREEMGRRGRRPDPQALRLAGELYRDFGQVDAALAAYRAFAATQEGEARTAAQAVVSALEDEKTLLEWEEIYGGRPTPEGRAAFEAGNAAFEAGDLRRAEMEFDRAIAESEWFPRAWYMRGVVRARRGKFARAAEDLERATRLDRTFFEAYLKLGLIYMDEFGGTRDEDARRALEAAVRLRPDLYPIHFLLGRLYARADRETARTHFQHFLEAAPPDDPDVPRARKAIDELNRDLRRDATLWVSPPPEESLRFLDPALQRLVNEAYLKVQQGNWARAEAILEEARRRFPYEPVALNQLAQVMYARGRIADARSFWEDSLRLDPDQVLVHEQLGLLLRDTDPDLARAHLEDAARLGSLRARFALAELLWDEHEWFAAKEALDTYFQAADKYDLYFGRATNLRRRIQRATLYTGGAGVVLLAFLVGFPALRFYRRHRGVTLGGFLARHPKSFPEVVRVLSLVRHEILKHNTAFLSDVGRGLIAGDPDAAERAAVLVRRLFGDPGGRNATPKGIYGRFLGYVQELHTVARSYGERLNLQVKDPIFRPILASFASVAAAREDLCRIASLRPSRQEELGHLLQEAGDVLGRGAFERISQLIRSMCTVRVDRAFVERVFEMVRNEDAFARAEVAPLRVDGEGATIRIFVTDLEDILVNVLRNSLGASLRYCTPPIELAVDLRIEVDEITGHESLAVRIKDRSPEQLSNEMLRGRYAERGMGITADLLSRYDGSIAVEEEPGWAKAVVLRFFVLESEEQRSGSDKRRLAS